MYLKNYICKKIYKIPLLLSLLVEVLERDFKNRIKKCYICMYVCKIYFSLKFLEMKIFIELYLINPLLSGFSTQDTTYFQKARASTFGGFLCHLLPFSRKGKNTYFTDNQRLSDGEPDPQNGRVKFLPRFLFLNGNAFLFRLNAPRREFSEFNMRSS